MTAKVADIVQTKKDVQPTVEAVNEEKIEATKSLLFSGNALLAIWVALGTASCWLISPLIGLVFLAFSAFSILIILRRQLCSSCYCCKSCTKGFAKMSMLFQGADHIPGMVKVQCWEWLFSPT
jgi:uncharacterized membrane protein